MTDWGSGNRVNAIGAHRVRIIIPVERSRLMEGINDEIERKNRRTAAAAR